MMILRYLLALLSGSNANDSIYISLFILGSYLDMEILTTLRCLAEIPLTFFSKFLNVTVHTYVAYEQGKMIPPPEIIKMIAMLYNIDESVINNSYVDASLIAKLDELAQMNIEDKYKVLSYRILGDNTIPNYHKIKKVKDNIRKALRK